LAAHRLEGKGPAVASCDAVFIRLLRLPLRNARERSPVYQFGETATNLIIQDLFDAVIAHVFIVHQRGKLVFQ
jgi:hypothetical protein